MRGGVGVHRARVGLGGQDRGERRDPLRELVAERQHVLHRRELRLQAADHRHVVVAAEGAGGDEDLRLGQLDGVPQLVRPELHGQRREDRADAGAGEVHDDQLDDVGQLHHHDVVAADAGVEQRLGQPVDGGLELAVGQALRLARGQRGAVRRVDDGDRLRRAAHVLEEEIGEGLVPPPAAGGVLGDALRGLEDHHASWVGRRHAGRDSSVWTAIYAGVVRSGGRGETSRAHRCGAAQPAMALEKLAHPVRQTQGAAGLGLDHRHAREPGGEQQAVARHLVVEREGRGADAVEQDVDLEQVVDAGGADHVDARLDHRHRHAARRELADRHPEPAQSLHPGHLEVHQVGGRVQRARRVGVRVAHAHRRGEAPARLVGRAHAAESSIRPGAGRLRNGPALDRNPLRRHIVCLHTKSRSCCLRRSATPELGGEGFSYVLASGADGCVLMDQVLDYNEEPGYMRDLLLHKLTCEPSTASRRARCRSARSSAGSVLRRRSSTGCSTRPTTASRSTRCCPCSRCWAARSNSSFARGAPEPSAPDGSPPRGRV